MTHGNVTPDHHLADAAIAAWVDERAGGDAAAAHLAACSACRARAAAIEELVVALRAEPELPHAAALAESRARIQARIAGARTRPLRRRSAWWIPTAAAAALAALLLARGGESPPPAGERAAGAEATLPVLAAADDAAAEAAAVFDTDPAGSSVTADDLPTTVLDPTGDPLPGAGIADLQLVEEFESLDVDEQEAVLMELAATEFEL